MNLPHINFVPLILMPVVYWLGLRAILWVCNRWDEKTRHN